MWQWDGDELNKVSAKRLTKRKIADPDFQFKGRLVARRILNNATQEMMKDNFHKSGSENLEGGSSESDEHFEGGEKKEISHQELLKFNPFEFI